MQDLIARLEAANPVDPSAFPPPPLELRRSRRPPALVAAVAAAAAIALVPGAGDEDVLARVKAAVADDAIVFTDARKFEFGKQVNRELTWTSSDGRWSRMLVYKPDGSFEGEIVSDGRGTKVNRTGEPEVDLPGTVPAPGGFSGDPLTLLTRALAGEDGLRVVGDHVLEATGELGTTTITIDPETSLPVSATLGLSTYVYDRVRSCSGLSACGR
jgi:hypothetical protein